MGFFFSFLEVVVIIIFWGVYGFSVISSHSSSLITETRRHGCLLSAVSSCSFPCLSLSLFASPLLLLLFFFSISVRIQDWKPILLFALLFLSFQSFIPFLSLSLSNTYTDTFFLSVFFFELLFLTGMFVRLGDMRISGTLFFFVLFGD